MLTRRSTPWLGWCTAILLVLGSAPGRAAPADPPFALPESWRRFRDVILRADSLATRRGAAAADAYLDSLVSALQARGDRVHLVQALVRRGGGRVYRGGYLTGEPDLREALALGATIRDTLGQMKALQYLAYGLGERGNTEGARPLWTRMLALSRARGDRSHAGWALMGLAYGHWREGRAARAQPLYRRSIAEFEACGDNAGLLEARTGYINTLPDGSPEVAGSYRQLIADAQRFGFSVTEGNALHNLANYEDQRGDPELALELLRRAEQAFARTNIATRWNSTLGRAIVLSNLRRDEEAARVVEPLVERARASGNWKLAIRSLETLATVRSLQGRRATSDSLRRRALAFADSVGPTEVAEVASGLAGSLLAAGRPAEARAMFERYIPRGATSESATADIDAATLDSRIQLALGRPAEALARLRGVAARASASQASRTDVLLELQFAEVFRVRGEPDSVLAHMRRARAQLLGRRTRARSFEQRERRGSGSDHFAGRYAADVLAAPSAGPAPQRPRVAFDDLQGFKARTLAERLSRTASASEEELLRHPVTLTMLQSRMLGADDVFVDIHEGRDESVAFVVTRGALQVQKLPAAAELARRARRLIEVCADPASDRVVTEAALRSATAALLGDGAARVLGARRVLVAADRATNGLPWAAMLHAARVNPGREVALVPSASWLASAPRRAGAAGEAKVLALAGRRNERGERLDGAEREVRWLAGAYGGVVTRLPGRSRTAEALAPELARYPLLHLAGHATHDDEQPWRAGLRLGDGDAPEDYLRAGGIARQRLRAQLVVLSACRSLGSTHQFGEGALGLTAGFLAAGSASVVATLWPVDDAAGEAFARAFYPALAEGLGAAGALARAQAVMRSTSGTAAVADWGAFVLVGRPDARVLLRAATPAANGSPRRS